MSNPVTPKHESYESIKHRYLFLFDCVEILGKLYIYRTKTPHPKK